MEFYETRAKYIDRIVTGDEIGSMWIGGRYINQLVNDLMGQYYTYVEAREKALNFYRFRSDMVRKRLNKSSDNIKQLWRSYKANRNSAIDQALGKACDMPRELSILVISYL